MPQSSELAGGSGFTFEDGVVASYLAALVAEANAPGIATGIVTRVAQQQRDFGEPLDDVIVDYVGLNGQFARLSLQAKRKLVISDALTNTDFRSIIGDSWDTFKNLNFRMGIDRYGAAVNEISAAKARALRNLCEIARSSLSPIHFSQRFAPGGNAGPGARQVRDDIVAILVAHTGKAIAEEDLHSFLSHFVLITFDLMHEGAMLPSQMSLLLQAILAPGHSSESPSLWDKLLTLARAGAGTSAEFTRPYLVKALSLNAHLKAAQSLVPDLTILTGLAQTWVQEIEDNIGVTRLPRETLSKKLDDALATSRFVTIEGLPGSGKSVLMRRRIETALAYGATLFLKSDGLTGKSWRAFASDHNIRAVELAPLLLEIGVSGTPIFFVDGIDRIEKQHRPIVVQIMRAIADSPLLSDWRIVVTSRDAGIEPIRTWLPAEIIKGGTSSVTVGSLDDDEAHFLSSANPALSSLLFGSDKVREIVRRPFFAKILSQTNRASSDEGAFAPTTEIDLIENWWVRGGFDSERKASLTRQRALIDLANFRAKNLAKPIALSGLKPETIDVLDELTTDGIIQWGKAGHAVRFSHDIFFEWSFLHNLIDRDADWAEEIKLLGEPPVAGRVIELLSQATYSNEQDWVAQLQVLKATNLRSQWLRAWLLGPLLSPAFEDSSTVLENALQADNYTLYRKALVWFQAEKTIPNPSVMSGALLKAEVALDERLRIADYLGWPSDFSAWRRFLEFIVADIERLPRDLIAQIVVLFEVWQNALADMPNPTSRAIVKQCSTWLHEIESEQHAERYQDRFKNSPWNGVVEIGDLEKALRKIVLRAARTDKALVKDYLDGLITDRRRRKAIFKEIIEWSSILAETHSTELTEITLADLLKELPADKVSRERREQDAKLDRIRAVREKPESERSEAEQRMVDHPSMFISLGSGYSTTHEWTRLATGRDDSIYFPASPLRQPFQALFEKAPDEALRLIRELSNHAMAAWRQLHAMDRRGTPIPISLEFPWGKQEFWGGVQEYGWHRGGMAPKPLASAYLALENWVEDQIDGKRDGDGLLKSVIEGNNCVAILGVATTIMLRTGTSSEITAALVTAQRLWNYDIARAVEDMSGSFASLIGFDKPSDHVHIEAIKKINARPVRKLELRHGVFQHILHDNSDFALAVSSKIAGFPDALPFEYEEEKANPNAVEAYRAQARIHAHWGSKETYALTKGAKEGETCLVHINPEADSPEVQKRLQASQQNLSVMHLQVWAAKSFESGALATSLTLADAISLARRYSSDGLFDAGGDDFGRSSGAIAGTAAVAIVFGSDLPIDDLDWARKVIILAADTPETFGPYSSPQSAIPWHPALFAARALAAEYQAAQDPERLLRLVAHPMEAVSLGTLAEIAKLSALDEKLVWSAFALGFDLCNIEPEEGGRGYNSAIHSEQRRSAAIASALQIYRSDIWPDWRLPPTAWIAKSTIVIVPPVSEEFGDDDDNGEDETEAGNWSEPTTHWYSEYASKLSVVLPISDLLKSDRAYQFVRYLDAVLTWTIEKLAPPWDTKGRNLDRRSANHYEWRDALGRLLGMVSGELTYDVVLEKFLHPIRQCEGELRWSLLDTFVDRFIRRFILDADHIPTIAAEFLSTATDIFLENPNFNKNGYRSGRFNEHHQFGLLRALMFTACEKADLAARYVNGDWSEINFIMPTVSKIVSAGGWSADVMQQFLTLADRAKASFPAGQFATLVLGALDDGPQGWSGTMNAARIAGLVQYLGDRETPMSNTLAQKFLRILDHLVDMGDRRSAALQISDNFREIRFS